MLKIISGLGVSVFLVVNISQAFSDVAWNHPHAEAIKYVESENIVSGYGDDTFKPDTSINRVELLKILVEAQPSPRDNCGVSAKYTDTDQTAWYQDYLEAAACRGIATGYSDLSFKPANPVLAAEAFKMITKTFGYAVGSESGEWYSRYLQVLADKFAIPRTIEAPDSALTRGQMAEMIYRLEKGVNSSQSSHTAATLMANTKAVVAASTAEGVDYDYVSKSGSTVSITTDDKYRYIRSNGLPNHETGEFPNSGNPNTISSQDLDFRVPLDPVYSEEPWVVRRIGVAINGIFFEPGTAETYNGDTDWRIEAIQAGRRALGLDINYAHVQPTGAYHYHGVPTYLVRQLAAQNTDDQLLIGYAADGHGIYYSQAELYKPSFQLKSGVRAGGPGGEYDGTYTADYEFVAGSGDLDDCNGKWVNGEYRYFLTHEFPYQPRCLHGVADASFGNGGRGGGNQADQPRTDFGPPSESQLPEVAPPASAPQKMPHEVCAEMGSPFSKESHSCEVIPSNSNNLKCAAGGGVMIESVCRFTPPGR